MGSNPIAATKSGDGVTASTSVSKTEDLGSNPSLRVLFRALILEAYIRLPDLENQRR